MKSSIRNYFIDLGFFFFFFLVMFSFIVGLGSIQTLVPGPPGSVCKAWTSCHGRGLKLDQVIGWPLPQFLHHLYPSTSCRQGQIVGQRFCDEVGIPIPLLEALLGYRRWPAQAVYLLVLGVLARVTLVDCGSFHCTKFLP